MKNLRVVRRVETAKRKISGRVLLLWIQPLSLFHPHPRHGWKYETKLRACLKGNSLKWSMSLLKMPRATPLSLRFCPWILLGSVQSPCRPSPSRYRRSPRSRRTCSSLRHYGIHRFKQIHRVRRSPRVQQVLQVHQIHQTCPIHRIPRTPFKPRSLPSRFPRHPRAHRW